MLAPERFQNESPNVIDLGDAVPDRPNRSKTSNRSNYTDENVINNSSSNNSHSSSSYGSSTPNPSISFSEDTRQHMYTASNKGHIPKGVRISYSLEADEEPLTDADPPMFDDDVDDPENGHSAQDDDGLLKVRGTESRRYQRQHHHVAHLQQQTTNTQLSQKY